MVRKRISLHVMHAAPERKQKFDLQAKMLLASPGLGLVMVPKSCSHLEALS